MRESAGWNRLKNNKVLNSMQKGEKGITHPILHCVTSSEEYQRLCDGLRGGEGAAAVIGMPEGARVQWTAALSAGFAMPLLVVTASEAAASRLCDDLNAYGAKAFYFPPREAMLSSYALASSSDLCSRRLSVMMDLIRGNSPIVVTGPEALLQRVAPKAQMERYYFILEVGETYPVHELLLRLLEMGYQRTDPCEGPGTFCLRGGILDLYPAEAAEPLRIEFFDDEVDSIRVFDPESQRSTEKRNQAEVRPACENPMDAQTKARALDALKRLEIQNEDRSVLAEGGMPEAPARLIPMCYENAGSIADWFPRGAIRILDDPVRVQENAKAVLEKQLNAMSFAVESGDTHGAYADQYLLVEQALEAMNTETSVLFHPFVRQGGSIPTSMTISVEAAAVAQYHQSGDSFREDLLGWRRLGYTVFVYAGSHAQRVADDLALAGIQTPVIPKLERPPVPGELLVVEDTLPCGVVYPRQRFVLVTERELYGQTQKKSRAVETKNKPRLAFTDLSVGDLVVHEAYGIGRFTGVESLTVEGNTRDYLLIEYAGDDKLFVPTDQLDRVQKYIGGDDTAPRLSKMGSGEWQKTVSRTREGVKELAFDLVKLYSARTAKKGFAFSSDGSWQRQLEERFPYEETPDQLTCIREVKQDMESDRVMDRLLCGDVGYGKTEVAVRAAFKAAMDSKQVAFLVPTTILAQQHYNTFCARYAGFPVNVELLSRFKSAAEQKNIRKRLKEGRIDVLIGTHKLLGKQVEFKDLGLLIIDEEQRFGVGHKEIIKNLKNSVDVLTLTATPIPRTLHMSMVGIRDMSVIETPPEQRFPVQTYVLEYSDGILREAVEKEVARGGQVYIVYNKVKDMERYAAYLSQLLPGVQIGFAHGQMNERVLEKTMLDFMEGRYDVLLCSTIIESGMDIPNVNTIIICDADTLGLAQLYQLRGRVGRSTRLGFAYFTFRRNRALTEVAEKRLMSIREFTQFGSGFKIAMRDLEIRGAGNLLGPEQHGHMASVGYDLYCKLMNQAVREAKGETVAPELDTLVEIPLDAHIPHGYIASEAQRMSMYKRIAGIVTKDDLYDVQEELEDRYGDIPPCVQNLLDIAYAKSLAKQAYVARLTLRPGEIRLVFAADAPLDGTKLFQLCAQTQGAQLYSGETITLTLKRNKAEVLDLLHDVPHFVYTILDCNGIGNRV